MFTHFIIKNQVFPDEPQVVLNNIPIVLGIQCEPGCSYKKVYLRIRFLHLVKTIVKDR